MLAQKAENQREADDLRMELVFIRDKIDALCRQMLEQSRRSQGRGSQGGQEEGQDDVQENGQ